MVSKRFCDFCGVELTTKTDIDMMEFLGQEKDICKECSDKITEFLMSIQKVKG